MSISHKFNIPPALLETIIKMNKEQTEYQNKVKELMKKKGITSLSQLSPDEKKAFFNQLDSMHQAKNEETVVEATSPAQQAAIAIAMKKAGKTPKDMKEAEGGGTAIKDVQSQAKAQAERAKITLQSAMLKMKHAKEREAIAKKKQAIKEEVELEEAKSGTGYELYHKDFSSAMAHAYDFAKKKYGIEVDPQEIDRNVAMGPKRPSSGKANAYRLLDKTGKKAIQVQVTNLDNKRYELNMYKEEVELEESFSDAQIAKMKQEYSKINTIDPSGDSYKKLTAMLDRMSKPDLEKLAGASIKFVSGLARNRVNRMKMKNEETEGKKEFLVKFEKDGKVSVKNYTGTSEIDVHSKAKVDAKRMGMTVASVRLKEEADKEYQKMFIEAVKTNKETTSKDNTKSVKAGDKLSGKTEPIQIDPEIKQ